MSPDQIDGYLAAGRALDPWINTAVDWVLYLGPGCVFVAAALATWRGLEATARLIRRRRQQRGIQRLESYANHPVHRRRDQQRKEKP